MRAALAIAIVICGGIVPSGRAMPQAPRASTQAVTLSAMQDRYRPLLVFAPSAGDPLLREQVHLLAGEGAAMRERDMILTLLPATAVGDPLPVNTLGALLRPMQPAEAQAARQRFHIAPGSFAVVLLGKDGGEKLRSAQPLPWQRLRDTIDAMPMRREEMRQPRGR